MMVISIVSTFEKRPESRITFILFSTKFSSIFCFSTALSAAKTSLSLNRRFKTDATDPKWGFKEGPNGVQDPPSVQKDPTWDIINQFFSILRGMRMKKTFKEFCQNIHHDY